MNKRPWPNGQAVIVPRTWVLTVVAGVLGAALVNVALGFYWSGQIAHEVADNTRSLIKIDEKLENLPPKELVDRVNRNVVEIARLQSWVKGAAAGDGQ